MQVLMTGWAHGKFGKLADQTTESMIGDVAGAALADAGLEPSDVGLVVVATMNNGFQKQDFTAALAAAAIPALRHTPAVRVENACASGSAGIHAGLDAVRSGRSDHVLVVGVEKMSEVDSATAGDILLGASYIAEEASTRAGFAGVFARIAESYFQKYGDCTDSLARISAKNHHNAMSNPYAHMQKDLGFDFCNTASERNPVVAGRLRRSDCSLVSDGAAALVLSSAEAAGNARRAVAFRAANHVNDFLPLSRRDPTWFEGAAMAWARAHAEAGTSVKDLSLVETHDCFTVAELMEYEAMGLAPRGQARRAIDEKWTARGGILPVNPSGGLKAKGHPIGATGVSQHILAAMQLVDEAADMQVASPQLAGVFNMGGVAVANYVSILERAR